MSGCGMLECTGCYGGGGGSNILVNGDNRSVLKKLEGMYASKARCIYIDPPYKNDETYSHYSDRASHDSWISDMRETLTGLYSFLSDDGSLWISIDDTEVHYLKVLCDELFGRKKFIATVIWQHRVPGRTARSSPTTTNTFSCMRNNPICSRRGATSSLWIHRYMPDTRIRIGIPAVRGNPSP